jgi:hypothetical protein
VRSLSVTTKIRLSFTCIKKQGEGYFLEFFWEKSTLFSGRLSGTSGLFPEEGRGMRMNGD